MAPAIALAHPLVAPAHEAPPTDHADELGDRPVGLVEKVNPAHVEEGVEGFILEGQMLRIIESSMHLADHIHEVPVFVIPCVQGRLEGQANAMVASVFGSIIPAAWSFMLAARSRGLGTVWTTFHLMHEREVAAILEIPYDEVTQVALIPVAYTIGTDFKPGRRKPLDSMVHWDRW